MNKILCIYHGFCLDGFGAAWAVRLRSMDGGVDVSAVARGYGGGGHAHAAGFKLPLGVEPARR